MSVVFYVLNVASVRRLVAYNTRTMDVSPSLVWGYEDMSKTGLY